MIAVTGIGVVAPSANSPDQLWDRVVNGHSPAAVPEGSDGPAVCAVQEPLELAGGQRKIRRNHRADRCVQLILLATQRAWADANLEGSPAREPARIGVVAGSSRGPVTKWAEAFRPSHRRIRPSLAADTTSACLHGSISAWLGAGGPSFTVSTACASGAHAVALGAMQIQAGAAELVVVAASDAPLHDVMVSQFQAAGILSPSRPPDLVCRPFDRNANGTVLGEGAGCLVLESVESARRRGARMQGLLLGWGLRGDGPLTSAEAAGDRALREATRDAMAMARLHPDDIGYINAHGTGTRRNDDLEMVWLREFDSRRQYPVPCGSTKATTGHCLGATPLFEAALCLEAISRGLAPRSVHCFVPHPDAPGGLVLEAHQNLSSRFVMSNSLGFWGSSASLIFGPPNFNDGDSSPR
ncbi:MAG: beta-ketoacyl-ACP synthase II [Terrimicrobiaceae bacterium]